MFPRDTCNNDLSTRCNQTLSFVSCACAVAPEDGRVASGSWWLFLSRPGWVDCPVTGMAFRRASRRDRKEHRGVKTGSSTQSSTLHGSEKLRTGRTGVLYARRSRAPSWLFKPRRGVWPLVSHSPPNRTGAPLHPKEASQASEPARKSSACGILAARP